MKNFINIVGTVTIVTWLGFSGNPAKALTSGSIDSDFVLNTTSYNANFGNNSVTGSFTDHFTFTTDALMSGSGGMSIISGFGVSGFGLNIPGFEVIFDSFALWDVTDNTNLHTVTIAFPFAAQNTARPHSSPL